MPALHDAARQRLQLPDALTSGSGRKITTIAEWQTTRRPEILELFRANVYGRAPIDRPPDLKFTRDSISDAMEGAATRKRITISYSGAGGRGAINLLLFVPKCERRVPCFLLISNRGAEHIDFSRAKKSEFWPAELLVARGYAAAAFLTSDAAVDEAKSYPTGVASIFDETGHRSPDAWGAVASWAWAASRVMDYLETDRDIEPTRVAVTGHSRGGKAALWAGAQDERFALVIGNNSGSTGAAIARGKKGETIEDINTRFPHWFCGNYKQFNGGETELPVDQHMLCGLIAPRLLYLASASEDAWADPEAEFLAASEASRVYQLFGLKGIVGADFPAAERPLHTGRIGYHLRTGEHGLTAYDWARFMDFADRHYQ